MGRPHGRGNTWTATRECKALSVRDGRKAIDGTGDRRANDQVWEGVAVFEKQRGGQG